VRSATDEAAQDREVGPAPLGRLAAEGLQRAQLARRRDDLLDRRDAEGADQLGLEVFDAGEEAEPGELDAGLRGAEAGTCQGPADHVLLAGVVQAGQRDAEPVRAEQPDEMPDVGHPAHRHHGDALGRQVAAPAGRDDAHRRLVAVALDEYRGPHPGVDPGRGARDDRGFRPAAHPPILPVPAARPPRAFRPDRLERRVPHRVCA
jgi:hypothetical protein